MHQASWLPKSSNSSLTARAFVTSAGSIRMIDPKSLLKTTSGRTSGQSGVGKGAAGSTLEYEITWSQQSRVESADAIERGELER